MVVLNEGAEKERAVLTLGAHPPESKTILTIRGLVKEKSRERGLFQRLEQVLSACLRNGESELSSG